MLLHLFFVIIYFIFGDSLSPETMSAISISQGCIALYISLRSKKEYINPYNVNLLMLILADLGNISLMNRIHTNTNLMYHFVSVPDIPTALTIWCIGTSFFFIGYLFFQQKTFSSVGLKFGKGYIDRIFIGVLIWVLFPSFVYYLISLFGSIGKIALLAGNIGILFFARLWASEGSKKYRNYVFILFVLQTYAALTHSYLRVEIIIPAIVLFAGYFAGKKSIKYLFSYRIIPFVVFLGLFMSLFAELGKTRSNFSATIQKEYFSNDDDEAVAEDIYEKEVDRGGFIDRSAVLAQISTVVRLTRNNGFYMGIASAPLITGLIPRALWPDKPKIAIGQWFAIETGTATVTDGKANNSINLTIPGELYMDFGWFAVILGCGLFGGLIVAFWNSAQFFESDYNLIGSIWGGYLLYMSLQGLSGDLQIVLNYVSFYLIFLVIKKVLCAYFV